MSAEKETLILSSSQNKYILGSDKWVQMTVKAADALADSGRSLICSAEPSTWDITAYLSGKLGIKSKIIIKTPSDISGEKLFLETVDNFALDCSIVSPVFLENECAGKSKSSWFSRDKTAAELSETIYPVSIRPGGKLERLFNDNKYNAKVRNDFRIDYCHENRTAPEWTSQISKNTPLKNFPDGEWLYHWTRASKGPWPGEKAWMFYRDVIDNPDKYVRCAASTLNRILSEKLIRGSSWKIAGGEKVVAMTESPPEEAIGLMRWRKRYVMFSFEPYGIAIRKDAATSIGAKPVEYIEEHTPSGEKGIFTHAAGEKTDWRLEKEWRIRDSIDLSKLDKNDFFAIVPSIADLKSVSPSVINGSMRFHALFD